MLDTYPYIRNCYQSQPEAVAEVSLANVVRV